MNYLVLGYFQDYVVLQKSYFKFEFLPILRGFYGIY